MQTTQNTQLSEPRGEFLALLTTALRQRTFGKMTLGKYRGREPELQQIHLKLVAVKGSDLLSFVYRYRTRDITKNLPIPTALETIGELLGDAFKSAHLFTAAGDASIEFSKKGKALLRKSKGNGTAVHGEPAQPATAPAAAAAPTATAAPTGHDRVKKRRVDPTAPFLRELGVADAEGKIIPAMSRKWKQMDKFLEIFGNAVQAAGLAAAPSVHVVDFGSGKGYLTFAVHDYLHNLIGSGAQVTGVELRPDLVELCNGVAARCGLPGLHFHQGDIRNFVPERIDVMIALHACDIATDLALHKGITAGATIIMSAPCCHKEIRPQMGVPPTLGPMLRHGVHMGQQAEMVTDTLRALLLEAHGYKTQVFEFVSLEHTSKNKMILAVRGAAPTTPARTDEILGQVSAIKEFYGIRHQTLEELLGGEVR